MMLSSTSLRALHCNSRPFVGVVGVADSLFAINVSHASMYLDTSSFKLLGMPELMMFASNKQQSGKTLFALNLKINSGTLYA
jgi:hypothetical protein